MLVWYFEIKTKQSTIDDISKNQESDPLPPQMKRSVRQQISAVVDILGRVVEETVSTTATHDSNRFGQANLRRSVAEEFVSAEQVCFAASSPSSSFSFSLKKILIPLSSLTSCFNYEYYLVISTKSEELLKLRSELGNKKEGTKKDSL